MAENWSRTVGAMLDMLGKFAKLGELSKYKALGTEIKEAIVTDIKFFATAVFDMAIAAKDILDDAAKGVIEIMGTAFGGLGDALDFILGLSELEEYRGVDFTIWDRIKSDIQLLLEDIADWDLGFDMESISATLEQLTSARDIVGAMRGIIEDTRAMMKAGGLDIESLGNLASQFQQLPSIGLGAMGTVGRAGGEIVHRLLIQVVSGDDTQSFTLNLSGAQAMSQTLHITAAHAGVII